MVLAGHRRRKGFCYHSLGQWVSSYVLAEGTSWQDPIWVEDLLGWGSLVQECSGEVLYSQELRDLLMYRPGPLWDLTEADGPGQVRLEEDPKPDPVGELVPD